MLVSINIETLFSEFYDGITIFEFIVAEFRWMKPLTRVQNVDREFSREWLHFSEQGNSNKKFLVRLAFLKSLKEIVGSQRNMYKICQRIMQKIEW